MPKDKQSLLNLKRVLKIWKLNVIKNHKMGVIKMVYTLKYRKIRMIEISNTRLLKVM